MKTGRDWRAHLQAKNRQASVATRSYETGMEQILALRVCERGVALLMPGVWTSGLQNYERIWFLKEMSTGYTEAMPDCAATM